MINVEELLRDPEVLQQLVDAGLIPNQRADVQESMQRAQGMADTAQPQGQTVGPYHAYVAASPLEHLAAALRQGTGQYRLGQGQRQRGQLTGQLGQDRLAVLRRLGQGQEPNIQEIPSEGTGGEF